MNTKGKYAYMSTTYKNNTIQNQTTKDTLQRQLQYIEIKAYIKNIHDLIRNKKKIV